MHLNELKIWNFRRFGNGEEVVKTDGSLRTPDLQLKFNKGLNLLVGENDSGKSAIVDAIKLVCKTTSNDWIKVEDDDFYKRSADRFRIECIFRGLDANEAKNFVEWLGREDIEGEKNSFLRLNLDVERAEGRFRSCVVKGGPDITGTPLDGGAAELLQLVYLKALRDAKSELTPRKGSRLSKILLGHKAFKGKEENHHLKILLEDVKRKIDEYFEGADHELTETSGAAKSEEFNDLAETSYSSNAETICETPDISDNDGRKTIAEAAVSQLGNATAPAVSESNDGHELKKELDKLLSSFFPSASKTESEFGLNDQTLKGILESLKLSLSDEFCGLGSDNLLFIATELLLLQREKWTGLKLGLIEEIEAHLHPQAQMRVIEYLQGEAANNSYQLILTSHSPNLASKVGLANLIVCTENGQPFPMGPGNTKLDENKDDYGFLQRFLDVTKANMFFAKGVILVEGYAEALLIPVIAEKIGRSLTAHGVSVVNVGSSAFLRFGRIFLRNDEKRMATKTAIITDYDFRPKAFSRARNPEKRKRAFVEDAFSPTDIESKLLSRTISEQNVRTFFSPKWTLEYCIALSKYHRKAFYKAVLEGWAEKKRAHGTKSTKSIDSKIEKIEEAFQNWTEDPDVIAYSIYNDIILNRQLSKAAIAQYFAIELQVGEYEIKEDDENLKYIIDAIKFVTDGSHD